MVGSGTFSLQEPADPAPCVSARCAPSLEVVEVSSGRCGSIVPYRIQTGTEEAVRLGLNQNGCGEHVSSSSRRRSSCRGNNKEVSVVVIMCIAGVVSEHELSTSSIQSIACC